MNTLEKCAEILLESKYCTHQAMNLSNTYILLTVNIPGTPYCKAERCDPFYAGKDTERECHARRQEDAIEDWLINNQRELWHKTCVNNPIATPMYQWRLDRIKWCISELCKE